MIVKATYFTKKVGDPNAPAGSSDAVRTGHFLTVPQTLGHSEKEIEVSGDIVKDISEGGNLDVDTLDLPYKRVVAKGEDAAKVASEKLEKARADAAKALEVSNANAAKLDAILSKLSASAPAPA